MPLFMSEDVTLSHTAYIDIYCCQVADAIIDFGRHRGDTYREAA
jgi:hypothetical protein